MADELPAPPPAPAATFKFATPDGVLLDLNGAPVTLRYTLDASKRICARFGGFGETFNRLFKFDAEGFSTVVAAGLGKDVAAVEQDVFATGYDSLLKPLLEYLAWLSNGGKAPVPTIPSAVGNV